ncbi:MAG: lyase family protein, partial [Cutibacterium granulosum]|uniref:lyase family protein n=1 Tax=Cutibacterium granulosum TaxID=33011 RepID=UPI002B2266B7
MNDTRIEVDLLGERKVPNDCYYGVHTLRALENFTISRGCMNDEPDFIRGMVFVKKASALTNKELGALPGDVADAIVAACDAILDEGRCMDQFPTDSFQGGAGTPWCLARAPPSDHMPQGRPCRPPRCR